MRTVKINNKDYEVVFGYRVMKKLSESGVNLENISSLSDMHMAALFSINEGLRRNKGDAITSEWLEDEIDKNPIILKEIQEAIGEQMETFVESFEGGK